MNPSLNAVRLQRSDNDGVLRPVERAGVNRGDSPRARYRRELSRCTADMYGFGANEERTGIVPLPVTQFVQRWDENAAATEMVLSAEDLASLDAVDGAADAARSADDCPAGGHADAGDRDGRCRGKE